MLPIGFTVSMVPAGGLTWLNLRVAVLSVALNSGTCGDAESLRRERKVAGVLH